MNLQPVFLYPSSKSSKPSIRNSIRGPIRKTIRLADISTWDVAAHLVLDPKVFGSLTDVEDGSDLDIQRPTLCPCSIRIPQPDEIANKNTAFDRLSEEARYVLGLVLETPTEVADLICSPKNGTINKNRIHVYLRKVLDWNEETIQEAFGELSKYVEALDM